jgi:SpoIID/LytB domain protein
VLIDKKKYLSEIRIIPGGSFFETGTGREIRYSTAVFSGREKNSRFDFPGELELASAGGWYYLINRVAVKDYIACVLISEMESEEPELVRAMAVLIRTLVFKEISDKYSDPGRARHPDENFLCCARTHCASYRGIISRARYLKALNAVNSAACEVLFYGGRPVHCLYSSSCGGMVKKASDIYPGAASEVYFEEKECPCRSTVRRWKSVYGRKSLSRILGFGVERVEACAKPYRIVINGKFKYTFDEFISAIEKSGLPRLKSPDFKASYDETAGSFMFEGAGLGHGAGLCISGARAMAAAGCGHKKILNYYYKSCILKPVVL